MSKRLKAPILLLLACTALVVLAENRSGNAEEIVSFEKARLAAFAQADKATFDRMMADDATLTHSSGGVSSKADLMGVMRPSTPENPLPALTIEEPKVRLYGDAAVLTGILVETAKDGRRELVLRFTNTYVRKDARWQMVAGQLTKAKS
jgi:ketosteroid isomerase-like protein